MNLETIEYQGWNCLRLSNAKIEVVVTLDVGPRIIRCGFLDGPNFFKEYSQTLGTKGGEEWNIFGGHRLWHAPENDPRTYEPDNSPIKWEEVENGVRFIQNVETTTGILKEIEVRLPGDEAQIEVEHFLTNKGLWPVEIAPWALSVMDTGGTAIIPLPPRGTHPREMLPTSSIVLWPYTNMSDPRWTWGENYLLLRQDESASTPQKIGARVPDGWSAYANNNQLFVKTFDFYADETYPDLGSVVEIFTNNEMLELETLAPTTTLQPDETDFHHETWHLFDGVSPVSQVSDVELFVMSKVREAQL